jgi:transposase InsO family protein
MGNNHDHHRGELLTAHGEIQMTVDTHRDGPTWKDRRDVEWQVARWVRWYNTARLHSSIGHLPPNEFEQHHRQGTIVTTNAEVA